MSSPKKPTPPQDSNKKPAAKRPAIEKEQPWLKPAVYLSVVLGLLFLITLIYYLPTLSGKTMAAHDYLQGVTSTKELKDFHDQTGKYAYWTGTMFSGMPAFQIWLSFKNLSSVIVETLYYGLDNVYIYISILVVLSAFALFYFMKVHPLIILLGGISLFLSTFSIVSLMAGHNNKVMVIALVPATLAGVWLLYEQRKYLPGIFLIALSVALQIRSNHFQITYFMMFLVGIWTVVNLVFWIKEKDFKHAGLSILLLVLGFGIGAINNTVQLITTQEYSAETQRGGPSPVEVAKQAAAGQPVETSGVAYDYATAWCYGKLETFTLLIPNFAGGASQSSLDENSNVYKALVNNGVGPMQAIQFSSQMPTYWGPQPFTAGTTYIGAVLIFLMIMGFVFIQGRTRIWLLTSLIVTLFIAWGKNLDIFYRLLFDYLPFFNKFRTPSMIFYLTTIIVVITAALGLQQLVKMEEQREVLWKKFTQVAGTVAGAMLFITLILPMIMSFESQTEADKNTDQGFQQQLLQATNNNSNFANAVYDGLLKDRKSMMQADALRSTIFVLLSIVLIALFLKRKLSAQLMLSGLAVLVLVDLWGIDSRYVNKDKFIDPQAAGISGPPMSEADKFILQDKDPSYRVLDLTVSTFNEATTSYYHKSIGGYHSAKLKRYQDIISYAFNENLSKFSQGKPEEANILNMLNTRYIMTKKEASGVIKNPAAFGNAWLVDTIKVMKDAVEVFDYLNTTNLTKTAMLESPEGSYTSTHTFSKDSAAAIKLDKYAPNQLEYSYESSSPSFAVFSEIYYNSHKGWVAYLNGEKTEHYRVNYILRGMPLPAGKHQIVFKFEPSSVVKGQKLDWAGSIIILLLGVGSALTWYRDKKKADSAIG